MTPLRFARTVALPMILSFWLAPVLAGPQETATAPPEAAEQKMTADVVYVATPHDVVDRMLNPGVHHATLHASGLASGVYYCRMTAGQYVNTRKLALLK